MTIEILYHFFDYLPVWTAPIWLLPLLALAR
jgi:hypothetical protein